jgi:hypothetical protein
MIKLISKITQSLLQKLTLIKKIYIYISLLEQ